MNTATGIVIRNSDGVQVAPGQSDEDEGFVEYCQWVAAGNEPTQISVPIEQRTRQISKLAFRNRFTATEKVMLEMASLDNPTAPMDQRQMSAMLRVYLKDLDIAEFVNLDYPSIRDGIEQLVAAGILTQDRVETILNTPIQPFEM
jgi:hypothetical protein